MNLIPAKDPSTSKGLTTKVDQDNAKKIFRAIFSGDSSLYEIFPRQVFVTIMEIEDLYNKIQEKLSRNEANAVFSAVVTYDNGKSIEIKSWERFFKENWKCSNMTNTISLHWRFQLSLPDQDNPKYHNINLRISSSLKPQDILQAVFSADPDERDQIEFKFVPMSAQIQFVDHVVAQELLDIISRWNKALPSPENSFPKIIKFLKRHKIKIGNGIEHITTIVSFGIILSSISYYAKKINLNGPILNVQFVMFSRWLILSILFLYLAGNFGEWLSSVFKKNISFYGSFSPIVLTSGDEQRRLTLMAKNQRSLYKFSGSMLVDLIINLAGGFLCFKFFGH
jgi:hypothetical protein